MRVLTVYAHPNPKSFCHAILQQFTKGLKDVGHTLTWHVLSVLCYVSANSA